jgi:hypothetical protein
MPWITRLVAPADRASSRPASSRSTPLDVESAQIDPTIACRVGGAGYRGRRFARIRASRVGPPRLGPTAARGGGELAPPMDTHATRRSGGGQGAERTWAQGIAEPSRGQSIDVRQSGAALPGRLRPRFSVCAQGLELCRASAARREVGSR